MNTHLNISGIVRCTNEPELSFTPSKKAVVKFTVASNSSYQNSDGDTCETSCFIQCTGWGKLAEAVNKYVAKGDPLYIEGQLNQDLWTDKEEKKHNRHSVRLEKVTFLKAKQD